MELLDKHKNIVEYLKKHVQDFKKVRSSSGALFTCPSCMQEHPSAHFIIGTTKVNCFACGFVGDIGDVIYLINPETENWTEKQVGEYIKAEFGIEDSSSELQTYLDFYEKFGFDMFPLANDTKVPIKKYSWTDTICKDKYKWNKWVGDNFNLAVKTGKASGITVIDIDTLETPEIFANIDTFKQKSKKGIHLIFKYDPEIPSVIRGMKEPLNEVDILNDGRYLAVYPTKADGVERKWNFTELSDADEIPEMPKDLKKFILSKLIKKPTNNEIKTTDDLAEAIEMGQLDGFSNIKQGNRNNLLIKFGGVLRKRLSLKDTEYVLKFLNSNFVEPSVDSFEFANILKMLDHYTHSDESVLASRIMDYLGDAETQTAQDIQYALNEKKAAVEKALAYLVRERKVVRRGRLFEIIKKIEWRDDFPDVDASVNFKVPYFDDIASFNWGDMVLIGSKAKYGKTTISMNIVKRLVEEGIKPYYICLESGSRFIKTGCQLGLTEGDFKWVIQSDPTKVKLPENSVIILDWLLVRDKAKTDLVMQHFIDQLKDSNSFLIVFTQLKTDGEWFAPNMATQFPALAVKYLYDKDGDGTSGFFEITEVRESKKRMKTGKLPCQYIWDKKLLYRVDELQETEKEEEF